MKTRRSRASRTCLRISIQEKMSGGEEEKARGEKQMALGVVAEFLWKPCLVTPPRGPL